MTPREFERVITEQAKIHGLTPAQVVEGCTEFIALAISATAEQFDTSPADEARRVLKRLLARVDEMTDIIR